MAVYSFLNEALEAKDSEPKGKAKRLIDKILSMMKKQNKDKKKGEEVKHNIDNNIKELNKATKEIQKESSITEGYSGYWFQSNINDDKKLRYYAMNTEELNKKLQKISNPKSFMEGYAIENELKSYLNKPQELTTDVSKKLISKVKAQKKKNCKALEELFFESNYVANDYYRWKNNPKAAKYKNDNDCLIEISFKPTEKDIKNKIEEANKSLTSAYNDKVAPAFKNFEKCENEGFYNILSPIRDQVYKWYNDDIKGINYDAWLDILESCNYDYNEMQKGYFSHDMIRNILMSYFSTISEAIKFNTKAIKLIKSGAKTIEPEVKKFHDQPEYGSALIKGNSDISSEKFISDIKSRYSSKKIKKCNLDYLLNEFKRNDDWEDEPYKIYNNFISKNKTTLDKIRNSDPVLVGKNTIDSGSYQSYIIYCVKTNSFYQLTYHEDMFGYEVKTIDFSGVKKFYEELEDMGG